MTEAIDAVDAAPSAAWLSISEIARAKGVSKQAVSKKVDRLAATGAIETRLGPGGQKLVNLAAYDQALGETTDLVRAQNGRKSAQSHSAGPSLPGPSGDNPILAYQQARKASYDADLKRLELGQKLGEFLRVADVEVAMARCAEALVRNIDQLASRDDALAAAVAREGAAGARAELKSIARDLRNVLAREMRLIAAEADQAHAAQTQSGVAEQSPEQESGATD